MGTGPQYVLAQLDESGNPVAIGPDNPLYTSGGGGGGSLPAGTVREVVGFDSSGNAVAVTLGWEQLSDQPEPPPFPNGVLTMARVPDGDDEFGLVELAVDENLDSVATPNAIPVYQFGAGGGQLPVATPVLDSHAATKKYVDDAASNGTFDSGINVYSESNDVAFSVGDSGLMVNLFNPDKIYLWGVSFAAGMIVPGAIEANKPSAPTAGSMYFDLDLQKLKVMTTRGEWEVVTSVPE